ncbi:MAG: kinase/pyrophosphorylase [Gammaproteobacteria bacterium]|nr:MAG: kinase/pyrophosphorylase [Gammaproteobacteria bacterium]
MSNCIRTVFYISDGTGITAETLGQTLLTQFPNVEFEQVNMPFINTTEKAINAVRTINENAKNSCGKPFVFCTIISDHLREVLKECDALFFDFFETFMTPMEKELESESAHTVGRSHGMSDSKRYLDRMNAVNYAVDNDDGITTRHYGNADVIIIGVSRSGKTPVSLYLALQHGIRAANYPLTDDDLESNMLPSALEPYRNKIFGLVIDPIRLQKIRFERRPNSKYSSMGQCKHEVMAIKKIFKRERINFVDSTAMSIEEISTTIIQNAGLKKYIRK